MLCNGSYKIEKNNSQRVSQARQQQHRADACDSVCDLFRCLEKFGQRSNDDQIHPGADFCSHS